MRDKIRVPDLLQMKSEGRRITMLTAYDCPFARIFDAAGVDALLVGDSLGMTVQGQQSTLPVTVEQIIYHTQMVVRGRVRALVIADMPFLSYQASIEQAVFNAGRLIKDGGAEAVKLEGGAAIAPTVRRLSDIDVPVMGHIGLTPQSVHRMGGFRVQGRVGVPGVRSREDLLNDAAALEEAGVFAIVLEAIPAQLAAEITAQVRVPTIGIGAGSACDGQVLVMHDLLGLAACEPPKFVKRYATLWKEASEAAGRYLAEVREGRFPGPEHSYRN
jgi:3-methyl-2-oxobutanoate hydroxymethyltransferase